MKTAIAEQFEAKGITARVVAFRMALAQFRNNGGTYDEALAELNAAYADGQKIYSSAGRLLSERAAALKMGSAVSDLVPKGQASGAAAPQPNAAKGHFAAADKAGGDVPDAATERSAGQTSGADKAVDFMPSASPRKMPGHSKRTLATIAMAQPTMMRSLFDTTKLPDGRSLREVSWAEVPHLASRYTFLSRVMVAIHRKGVPADPADTLDKLVNEDELKQIIGTVERLNDIH